MAELIRQGVALLRQSTGAAAPAEPQRRSLALAGRFRSDVNDVALPPDPYLAAADPA